MRMTPRLAGRLGRIGFRSISPRISPGPDHPPGEGVFVFPGSITEKTYKITPQYGHIVIIGFFGRHRGGSGNFEMTATWNGQPMTVLTPTYVGTDRGVPGYAYIENVTPGVEGEVVFTMVSGTLDTGALRFMDPPEYTPINDQAAQIAPWSGNGGSGGALQMSAYNTEVNQILQVGGYGGIRTPINIEKYSTERYQFDWVDMRQQIRVESTVVPGSTTSIVFSYLQTFERSAIIVQRPNQFSMENGYGIALFKTKAMGLSPP